MVSILTRENSYQCIDSADKAYLGKKYYNAQKKSLVHETRCAICGRRFNYEITKESVLKYMQNYNWSIRKQAVEHCGNQRCDGYHRASLQSWERQEDLKTLKHTAIAGSREFNRVYEQIMERTSRRI